MAVKDKYNQIRINLDQFKVWLDETEVKIANSPPLSQDVGCLRDQIENFKVKQIKL